MTKDFCIFLSKVDKEFLLNSFMNSDKISAISTAVIAFVTIIGLMIGFYYNLKSSNTKVLYILIFELLILISSLMFTLRIMWELKNGQ